MAEPSLPYDLHRDELVASIAGYRDLTLDLMRPTGDEPAPVVVWIHGGAYFCGTHRALPEPLQESRLDERLVAAGFAVARASYRFSAEAPFPAQHLDVRAAIRWVRRNAERFRLDASRLGVWGESAGGHLAALACLAHDVPFAPDAASNAEANAEADAERVAERVTNRDAGVGVQAGVLWYAPSDLLTMQEQNRVDSEIDHNASDSPAGMLLGAPIMEVKDAARAASPVTYARADAPPMLLVHGADDRVVPVGQSEELHEALLACGADSSLTIVEGADHCFGGVDLDPLVDQAITFFQEKLRPVMENQ
jgi:acetyl esterase/lipase